MTPQNLKASPRKTLESIARKRGVSGCTSMKKDELIRAILKTVTAVRGARKSTTSTTSRKTTTASSSSKTSSRKPASTQISAARRTVAPRKVASSSAKTTLAKTTIAQATISKATISKAPLPAKPAHTLKVSPVKPNGLRTNGSGSNGSRQDGSRAHAARSEVRLHEVRTFSSLSPSAASESSRSLATTGNDGSPSDRDSLVAMVLGPYWLRAHWSLTPNGVRRAELSLGTDWHRSTPVLRLLDVSQRDGASNIEVEMQQIVIHSGVRDWYVPLDGEPRTYRLQIGYSTPNGKFYSLARSNIVTPPLPGNPDAAQGHWMDMVENCEQVYAMSGGYSQENSSSHMKELFEQRMQRSMEKSPVYSDVPLAGQSRVEAGVKLNLKTEVIVYGVTSPNAQVVFDGKPVKLDALNSFRLRMPLNEGRHVIPISSTNCQTSEQQTAVIAIDRNMKVLDLKTPEDF